jgi:hypothetical protein
MADRIFNLRNIEHRRAYSSCPNSLNFRDSICGLYVEMKPSLAYFDNTLNFQIRRASRPEKARLTMKFSLEYQKYMVKRAIQTETQFSLGALTPWTGKELN